MVSFRGISGTGDPAAPTPALPTPAPPTPAPVALPNALPAAAPAPIAAPAAAPVPGQQLQLRVLLCWPTRGMFLGPVRPQLPVWELPKAPGLHESAESSKEEYVI